MFVKHRYKIKQQLRRKLESMTPEFGFNGFGQATYYRTYSRLKEDGSQEQWSDTVIRVVEGVLSIRKDWYKKHGLPVNIKELDDYAERLAVNIFEMKMLPPGRGLFINGTDYMYERGAFSLYNCAFAEVKKLSVDMSWSMDALMSGIGVGYGVFNTNAYELKVPGTNKVLSTNNDCGTITHKPDTDYITFIIPDTREGWINSVKLLLESYEDGTYEVRFDYSEIRPYGAPIRGFGGTASGFEVLLVAHNRIKSVCGRYINKDIGWARLCADISNSIGACVVAGSTRRSALILLGNITDNEFIGLKDYDNNSDFVNHDAKMFRCTEYHKSTSEFQSEYWEYKSEISENTTVPEWKPNTEYDGRSALGWMSNNSVRLENKSDFRMMPKISKLIEKNGEPGIVNLVNMQEYGKFGVLDEDPATGTNPCLPATAKVLTCEGIKDLSEVDIGDYIWSETGWTKILNKWSNGIKKTYKYYTSYGIFYGTDNHKIVQDGVKIEVGNANQIDVLAGEKPININKLIEHALVKFEVTKIDSNDTTTCIRHSNPHLLRNIQLYLNSFGCISEMYMCYDFGWILEINHDGLEAKYGNIIDSVEYITEEEVFDITVDNATHTFWSGGHNVSNCGEIPLESYELCNLSEVFPTRCNTKAEFYGALELASFYSSTVSLLPTHRPETNEVVNRNHRIGVSISGIADWFDAFGAADCIPMMRKGYKIVKRVNTKLAKEAGVSPSIRVTCVKPSGSISQLAGVSSGMHFPTFKYAIRRMRVGDKSNIVDVLKNAGIPWEVDTYSDNTLVFEFPIDQGKTRPAKEVSAWEQFALLSTLQREWADNMVSCTVYFDPKTEASQIEHMLGQYAPTIKSVSMLPHTDAGAYAQMPYEGITKEEYEARKEAIRPINWETFGGSDGMDSKFCNNDTCMI